ncbi:TlpA family protein disulfide reductase [Tenacibaculum geojense]|uniref:TlpA family protein disulfide reductase n=1 Tax=Tenacibaculum geojense TaxID=915352 RepID=A0ABW3JPY8_9FLAO
MPPPSFLIKKHTRNIGLKLREIIKYYIIGFFLIYLIMCGIFFFYLTQIKTIDIDTNIPLYKLEDQFKEKKSFDDFKGRYLLVDFWFSECKPCIDEMKYFPELLKKYKSNLTILSLSIDNRDLTLKLLDKKPKPFEFIDSNNPNWIFQNDNLKENSYVKKLEINSFPTYLLFDKNGRLISSPSSGIAGVEYEIGGLLDMNLTIKSKQAFFIKFFGLIIPYTILFCVIIIIIKFLNRFKKNRNTDNIQP